MTQDDSSARYDVLEIKEELCNALGDKNSLYWSSLKDFVKGRINRLELDSIANQHLNRINGW